MKNGGDEIQFDLIRFNSIAINYLSVYLNPLASPRLAALSMASYFEEYLNYE